ncbi:7713_t:CDS:10 [Funneliformis mosseae]|uniref:DNA polymerase n=1 Tax=Funneliformis mosseae TaxID=27381 RepID=A0A9N8Z5V0_FUNMO|nr:7713_t:CDS:10 [Funneliformis mosseae]
MTLSKRRALETLRRLREEGGSRLQEYEIQEPSIIYDEVTEEIYQSEVKKVTEMVVNDDGTQYITEELDDLGQKYTDDSEYEDDPADGKRKRKSLENITDVKPNTTINNYFLRAAISSKMTKPKNTKSTKEESEFMSDLLQGIVDKQEKSNQESSFDNEIRYQNKIVDDKQENFIQEEPSFDDEFSCQNKFDNVSLNQPINSNNDQVKCPIDKEFIQSMQEISFDNEFCYQNKIVDDKQENFIQEESSFDNEFSYQNKFDNVSLNQPINSNSSLNDQVKSPIDHQSNNCYQLFWIDAIEKAGLVYIVGKVFDSKCNSYISCCVTVKNIHRNIFVLPRQKKLDENDHETESEVTMEDVGSEIYNYVNMELKVLQLFTKPVRRRYGFELPDVPAETQYLKVMYPFKQEALPKNLSGKTFSRVFGTNTSALELFLLKRKIKGPCWLEIKDSLVETSKISWCKLELLVEDPKSINPLNESNLTEHIKPPPLTIMSLSLRTILNEQKQVNEIVAFSVRFYPKVSLDETVPPEQLQHPTQYSAIRQLNNQRYWPRSFEELVREEKQKGLRLNLETNEFSLINYLLALIKQYDPDIFVGHNFIGFDLDVLLHRLKMLKIKDWSCLGRFRRHEWPRQHSGSEVSFAEKSIVNGRLICDTYLNAKDLIKSKNYSLTELVSSQLGKLRKDIEYDKFSTYYGRAKDLLYLVCHCWNDAILTAELMLKLQILLLTKQLTNLAGNIWSKTLAGARAERNEFLLLHEFHQHKYICPDKEYKKNQEQINTNVEDEQTETKKSGRKKPTYAGGLVLEPKKGFYDNYVVLLDFNSLYPSIIQEYNICFTTVDRVGMEKDDITPEVPDSSLPQGVLPKLIANLVERRRMVKNLMKDPKVTPSELVEYDIRQKALKLTANSMYGCLGFPFSRFYAKPLAMLITSKGREILENTVKLAESEKMEVIYGDTDSIMISTRATDIREASEVGNILKKKVNERYKLVELEIDGYFEKLLLLKKKKYAAIVIEEKNGNLKRSCEMKGLDLVRRDWCDLVHQILSSCDREVVVNNIHAYLREVGEHTRSGKYPIYSFIINKNLAKPPEAYPDVKIQPHVQVALRMKTKGLNPRTGDTIPYVICLTTEESDKSIADRAFHPDEIGGSNLQIVHASVSRLCEHVDGIDNVSIAEWC